MIRIISPATDQEWRDTQTLMSELKDWDLEQSRSLGLDAGEVARFFYPYVDHMTRGSLLLAMDSHSPVGCAAMYRLDDAACELHSVYVRPASRGAGIAGQLVRQLVEQAREAGYRVMRLETATFMGQAQKLYGSLGFRLREPYRSIPRQFAAFTIPMELDLG
jgi:ribosomal protein S18 acetylase RimI-like enzyme